MIKGHHVGEPDRDAEILEVHGEEGAPPSLVRWRDDGDPDAADFRGRFDSEPWVVDREAWMIIPRHRCTSLFAATRNHQQRELLHEQGITPMALNEVLAAQRDGAACSTHGTR